MAQIGDIEQPLVRFPVSVGQPRAIQHERYGKVLHTHVVHHLIVPALQERGVHEEIRSHSALGQSRAQGHRVFLGDAHVEKAFGILRLKSVRSPCQASSPR